MLSYRAASSQILLCLAVVLGTVHSKDTAPHQINCVGQPDGLHEIGCWGYANCVNEKPDIHACGVGTVLDRSTLTCVKPGTGNTDCYLPVDCTGKQDGSYADYGDKCISYYRCINEKNLGRFYCPKDTAFNEALQLCDYPRNLPAPCGPNTMAPTQSTTTTSPTTAQSTTVTTTTTPAPTTATTTTTPAPTTGTTTPPLTTTTTTTKRKPLQSTSQVVLPIIG